mmetsp:Transcript_8528/g.33556  ORF Transcript_8528/g.33556 Transcript_8528/m.33556 type:complete len:216 (+) Transcript_8528:1140-1787(+)
MSRRRGGSAGGFIERGHVVEPGGGVVDGHRSKQREERGEELVGALEQQMPRGAFLKVLSLLRDGVEGVDQQRVARAEVRHVGRGLPSLPPLLGLLLGPLVGLVGDPKSVHPHPVAVLLRLLLLLLLRLGRLLDHAAVGPRLLHLPGGIRDVTDQFRYHGGRGGNQQAPRVLVSRQSLHRLHRHAHVLGVRLGESREYIVQQRDGREYALRIDAAG